MNLTKPILVFAAAIGTVHAADPPLSVTSNSEQAQARQFGIFFGGTASQFDLCVKKGFLAKGNQSAEEIATSILEKMQAQNHWTDQYSFVQDGWDTMKKEIGDHEAFYTQEKCVYVGKEWAKILATMHAK